MARPMWVVAGAVLAVAGAVWALQGFGVIGGSAMSNTTTWSIIGPIVVVVGLWLVLAGIRGRKG